MAANLIPSRITVTGRPLYRCADCGATDLGDTATVEVDSLDGLTTQGLARLIHPTHMPVGWAAYGRTSFRCPSHAK